MAEQTIAWAASRPEIVSTDLGRVLPLISQGAPALDEARRRVGSVGHSRLNHAVNGDLRTHYGFGGPDWSERGRRTPQRVVLCLAADVALAPYAKGVWDAIAQWPTNLLTDLRAICVLLGTWTDAEHPALAKSLAAARLAPDSCSCLPFRPISGLLRRPIDLHCGPLTPEDDALIHELSGSLVWRLGSWRSGSSPTRLLLEPLMDALRDSRPGWLPAAAPDVNESLIAGCVPIVLEVIQRERTPGQAIEQLERLRLSIEAAGE